MNIKTNTRRVRAAIVGTLLAGVMTVGVAANAASAEEAASDDASAASYQVGSGSQHMSMRGGIRW